jgi:hypothetical protein
VRGVVCFGNIGGIDDLDLPNAARFFMVNRSLMLEVKVRFVDID